jgi:hypothetical protein
VLSVLLLCAEILSGRDGFQSSPFGCTSGQALKGDLVYLPIFPTVETVGYFHSSGCAGLSTISDNQFGDNQFKSVQRQSVQIGRRHMHENSAVKKQSVQSAFIGVRFWLWPCCCVLLWLNFNLIFIRIQMLR